MMSSSNPEDPLARLADAVDVYLANRDTASGSATDRLIAEHPALRDLLEPMLAGQTESAPESPRFFGDFELLREIGRGGMGIVHEAIEVPLHRRVALKVLPDGPHLATSMIERFRREAAAASRLRHPGIVAVYRVGEHAGAHYFAMEIVDGADLGAVIERLRREVGSDPARLRTTELGLVDGVGYFAEVAELVARVGDALAFAHANGVVHRDVKPHNVLLGANGVVKIADFGLAKDFDRQSITRAGDDAGTPDYMSPEQVRGAPVDARTDVYSLGVVLYELLTLRRPFRENVIHDTLHAIVTREPPGVRKLQPRVPQDLETICHKAIAKGVSERYATMSDFVTDLRRFRRHEPVIAARQGAMSRAVKLVRRNRAVSAALGLAVLAFVIAPILFAIHFKRAAEENQRQRDKTREILAQARASIDDLYVWLGEDRLESEPGMVELRTDLLERAVAFYERFCALAEDDTSLRVEAEAARVGLGIALAQLDRDGAEQHLVRAIASLERIGGGTALAFDQQVALARAHEAMEGIVSAGGRQPEARAHLDAAMSILSALDASTVANQRVRDAELAKTHEALARWFRNFTDDRERVAEEMRSCIGRWQSVVDSGMDNDAISMRYGGALASMARLEARSGDYVSAAEHIERAIERLDSVVEHRPRSARSRRRLASALGDAGEISARRSDWAAALAFHERSAAVAGEILEQFPEFGSHALLFAMSLHDLSIVLIQMDRHGEAAEHLQDAWTTLDALLLESPDLLPAVTLMASVAGPLAVIRVAHGILSPKDALAIHDRAIAALEQCAERHADSSVLKELLATAIHNRASQLRSLDDPDAVRAAARRSIAIVEELIAGPSKSSDHAAARMRSLVLLAKFEIEQGRFDDALELVEELGAFDPGDGRAAYESARLAAIGAEQLERVGGESGRVAVFDAIASRWLDRAIEIDPENSERCATDATLARVRSRPAESTRRP